MCLSSNFDHSQLFILHKGRAFPQTSSMCQREKKEEQQAQKQYNSGCTATPACTAVRQYQHLSPSKASHRGQGISPSLSHCAKTNLNKILIFSFLGLNIFLSQKSHGNNTESHGLHILSQKYFVRLGGRKITYR